MGQDDYIDLFKRVLALGEAGLEASAMFASILGILVAKGICTQQEFEEVKQAFYETETMKRAMQEVAARKAEIEELEKAGSSSLDELFADLFEKKGE